MDTAAHVLIIGGMSVLAFGFLLGIPMAMARSKAAHAPRYLFAAHLAAIIQGGLLLAPTIAIDFSGLSPGVETVGASLMVGGVILFDAGLVLNWLQDVEDAFAEESIGNKVSGVGTPMVLTATAIIFYGVVATI